MSDLLELAERCERATGPDQGLNIAIHTATTTFEPRLGGPGWPAWAIVVPAFPGWKLLPEYTASLDAAMTLVPDGQGWSLDFDEYCKRTMAEVGGLVECFGKTPALALCAAALKARAANE